MSHWTAYRLQIQNSVLLSLKLLRKAVLLVLEILPDDVIVFIDCN